MSGRLAPPVRAPAPLWRALADFGELSRDTASAAWASATAAGGVRSASVALVALALVALGVGFVVFFGLVFVVFDMAFSLAYLRLAGPRLRGGLNCRLTHAHLAMRSGTHQGNSM